MLFVIMHWKVYSHTWKESEDLDYLYACNEEVDLLYGLNDSKKKMA